jgi:glutamate N-acetyltransferase / amino-acid N-acetyltransferase
MDAVSVVAARGFRAAGLACGIKPSAQLDLVLLAADQPVAAAGVFTTSLTAAPPVQVTREHVASGRARALVVNSGAANAGTGAGGVADARAMAAATADELGCDVTDVLVCSTGPIGGRLPMDRIVGAVPRLVTGLGNGDEHSSAAARGILTTDSVDKTAVVAGDGWVIGGMAKGAGMVRPDMATMLAFLTTDAVVDSRTLRDVLQAATDVTFNALNIDGCQSTNDTVILMASGASGVEPDPGEFVAAVEGTCRRLTAQMARDAEGATKVVTLEIGGAADDRSARRIGMAVADSSLVRASFYGADPNWGRILAALGACGEKVDPAAVGIAYDSTVVCSGGTSVAFDDDALSSRLEGDFTVEIVVGDGDGRSLVTTTDLTPEYVVFNGERS